MFINRPIHDAVEGGNFEIVTILVEHGADPMVEHSERTPIEIAKSANFPKIVAYLSGMLTVTIAAIIVLVTASVLSQRT